MLSLINHDSSEGEQWGRYNLPIYIYKYPYENELMTIENKNMG